MLFRCDSECVCGRELINSLVGCLVKTHRQMGEIVHYPLGAYANGQVFYVNQCAEAGCAEEQFVRQIIVKGPDSHLVPAAENLPFFLIVNNKYEIPDQMIDAVFLPFEVAFQDEFGVANTLRLRLGDVDLASQFLPIIDSGPGRDTDLCLIIVKRRGFQSRWGRIPVDALDQQDARFFY